MKRKQSETATHAVTHIRLGDANRCKLDALDAITVEYMALCQQYVHHFCILGKVDKFATPLFDSLLSQRWQRVAIQQAAGCAQSWLTNRENHAREYERRQAYYEAQKAQFPTTPHKVPVWTEPELPTSSASGARLTRHVKQSINRAVNQCFEDHPHCTFALEQLSVAGMRFKARAMNAYLYASNLAHIPKQIEWGAKKRGLPVVFVNPAYSSQECNRCHYVSRENRPNQQTFCCVVCGHQSHADTNASRNLACRAEDEALRQCRTLEEVKALLLARHQK